MSFSIPDATTIAHELGHNLSLYHAPCGGAGAPDPSYPRTDGSIGAWDTTSVRAANWCGRPDPDLMTYCGPYWISDYHFTNALRYRLHRLAVVVSRPVGRTGEIPLALGWDRRRGDSIPGTGFRDRGSGIAPAFHGPVRDHRAYGWRWTSCSRCHSKCRNRPTATGRSSFAFVLPGSREWADQLAAITLSGPGARSALDQDTDRPVTILRNPRSGQVRAILRGPEAAPPNLDAAVSALSRTRDWRD